MPRFTTPAAADVEPSGVFETKNHSAIAGSLLLTVVLWGGNNVGTKWLVSDWPLFIVAGVVLGHADRPKVFKTLSESSMKSCLQVSCGTCAGSGPDKFRRPTPHLHVESTTAINRSGHFFWHEVNRSLRRHKRRPSSHSIT
jgi:hypothetical protein